MHYLDTSVLAAVFFRERGAEALVARLRRWRQRPQLVSSWTLTEMASAGSLKVRTGAIDVSMREEALAHFQRFTSAHLRVVEIDPGDFRVASSLLDLPVPLRAGDALHLAVARRCGARLVSLDKRMCEAAVLAGVPLASLGAQPARGSTR